MGTQKQHIIVTPTKSVGVSLVLTFLFGSFGMLYSTIIGAIIMIVIELIVGIVTFGIGLFITHIICMVWGALAAHNYNQRLLSGTSTYTS